MRATGGGVRATAEYAALLAGKSQHKFRRQMHGCLAMAPCPQGPSLAAVVMHRCFTLRRGHSKGRQLWLDRADSATQTFISALNNCEDSESPPYLAGSLCKSGSGACG